jgi:hypothetical protein
MYNPEKFRKDKEILRAEIEANRTPKQKIEAERIRAQRAAYNALPNNRKTEIEELEVFNAFAAVVAEARIDSDSGRNAVNPEPDIRCTVAGAVHYFEIGEMYPRACLMQSSLTSLKGALFLKTGLLRTSSRRSAAGDTQPGVRQWNSCSTIGHNFRRHYRILRSC